eukprot:1729682-Rhodomonas_salina.1
MKVGAARWADGSGELGWMSTRRDDRASVRQEMLERAQQPSGLRRRSAEHRTARSVALESEREQLLASSRSDTDTQTHRHTHRHTHTDTQTHRHRQTQTDTQKHTDRHTETERERERETWLTPSILSWGRALGRSARRGSLRARKRQTSTGHTHHDVRLRGLGLHAESTGSTRGEQHRRVAGCYGAMVRCYAIWGTEIA